MTVAWIVGCGGMLGSALCQVLDGKETRLFYPAEKFHWDCEDDLKTELEAAVAEFVSLVANDNEWEIYWAAGVGTMSSAEAELAVETRALSTLLGLLESTPGLAAAKGRFALASSAGAIYAGATDDFISENTPVAPTTAYAYEKLKQEDLVRSFTLQNSGVTTCLARISTLYGSGKAAGKQQGLLVHIARCILRNQPIQIYVPFDTIRDYIAVDDAATKIVSGSRTLSTKPGVFTKIIASEIPTTIAEIISIFKRITRRTPRIVTSSNSLSDVYSRRIQFRSIETSANEKKTGTSLAVGIAQVLAAERSAYMQFRSR